MHKCVFWDKSSYKTSLRVAANSAALPVFIAVVGKKDIALISASVISQIRQRPSRHGVGVKLSCLLPSGPDRLCGSWVVGMPARFKLRWIMSLR